MKRIFAGSLSVLLIVALSAFVGGLLVACGQGQQGSTLSGATSGIIDQVYEKGAAVLAPGKDFPQHDSKALTAQDCQSIVGLITTSYDKYVEEATISQAMINTSAHLVVLFKCKSDGDAATLKSELTSSFDPGRWICVRPDQCFVQQAGSYVLLVAANADNAEALKAGFAAVAGVDASGADVFYKGEGETAAPSGDGGLVLK
ncbi:MAG: hypothetical protein LBG81_02595 [Coriobacteriaceae bacterium]|jgi:hypothetical protein|nr:hypothetical protein [Coriobacteriaceae bacterium]